MGMFSDFSTTIIGFLTTIAFGFWMSRRGRPYNGILFNIHKLVALGTVILASMQLYQQLTGVQPQLLINLLIVLAGLGVIALFATGAMLSIGRFDYRALKTLHKFAPFLVVICPALAIYLLRTGV